MQDKITPLQVFMACFGLASLGGLTALLRSGRPLTVRTLTAAVLYSGLMGVIIGLVWYNYFDGQNNVFFLMGVSGLAGLGGTTLLDFVVQLISKGGVNIIIKPKDD
jgi:hypothetical protein